MLYVPRLPKKPGSGAESLEQRMKDRLEVVADAIQECSHATNEYYKMKFIRMYPGLPLIKESLLTSIQAKMMKSSKWEEKFTDFATKFKNFQSDIQEDLALFTSDGVQVTVRAVEEIKEFMKLVFTNFATPEEEDLLKFIRSKGGPEVFIKDDNLLQAVIERHKSQQGKTRQEDSGAGQGEASFNLGRNFSFDDIKKELNANLDAVLAGNQKFFDQKFKEQRDQIKSVKDDIRREGDRVVGHVLAGPHDRILDKVGIRSLFIAITLT